jgi:acetyltransferase-like isoleucine patch superfamily enzyme
MPILLDASRISQLKERGVSTFLQVGSQLPEDCVFEPPCSLKWMQIEHSLRMGAFSYGVSGFYFACRIGRYCSFGEEVQIGRHAHPMHWVSTSPFFYNAYENVMDQRPPDGIEVGPDDFVKYTAPAVATATDIGHDVWIGHGAFILPGVTIGTGAVIAARSVVTRDVPPYALVAGSPATVRRFRFEERQVARLLESRWWEYAPWQLKGGRVDEVEPFLTWAAKLRESAVAPFSPDALVLKELVS